MRLFNIYDTSNLDNRFKTTQNARFDIIGELEAIIQYENHLNETNITLAKETFEDIASEEKVHVGELFGLLFYLDPDSKKYFEQGLKEFEERKNHRWHFYDFLF